MRNRVNQIYEDYWNYTAAFTDFNSSKFLDTLRACVAFIDENAGDYSAEKYSDLQLYLNTIAYCKAPASQRKRINQLVKLGFIRPFLRGYPQETLEYLKAVTDRKRKSILSKIVYKYANLCNSVTNDIQTGQLTFFIKSLEEVGSFTEKELAVLMTVDINAFHKDHVDGEDLERQAENIDIDGFIDRKYNQVNHLKNLLGKLDDLVLHDNVLYFQTDAERLFGNAITDRKEVRDSYLQRIYKNELEEESMSFYASASPKCMVEGVSHPVLIASHIKPYRYSDENEAFDVNNGLLLSKNIDSLFDRGYITFDEDGTILPSNALSLDVVDYLSGYKLDAGFMNPKRMEYMQYHREHVFQKNIKSI